MNFPCRRESLSVAIFYKTKHNKQNNHYHAGGLAANAVHSIAVLREMGIEAELYGVESVTDVAKTLAQTDADIAIIEAVWISAVQLQRLADAFPGTRFVVRAHSKIGFLQVEPEALLVMRDIIELSHTRHQVALSSNNEEFALSLQEAYHGPCLYLPNLYDLKAAPKRKHHTGVLKIASFGATRLLKLHPTAALASLQTARRQAEYLEFYINVDSTPGGDSVRRTMRNLFAGLSWAKLVEVTWQDTQTFKETIAQMDLVFQLSATETFCLVAADAVASGVPVVVGPAIDWVPAHYRVNIDNTSEAAALAHAILKSDKKPVKQQQAALASFVKGARTVWKKYLTA